jgi:hypothetical protein
LAEIEKAISAAKGEGSSAAIAELTKKLGFDKPADLEAFVKAQRDAADKAKTDEQKRIEAIEARERDAADREAKAAERERVTLVKGALLLAGAPKDGVDDLTKLVDLAVDDADEAKATAAVEAVKAKFPALFAPLDPKTPPAPSGVPGGGPPKPPPAEGLAAKGAEMARAYKTQRSGATKDDLLNQFGPRTSPLAPTA